MSRVQMGRIMRMNESTERSCLLVLTRIAIHKTRKKQETLESEDENLKILWTYLRSILAAWWIRVGRSDKLTIIVIQRTVETLESWDDSSDNLKPAILVGESQDSGRIWDSNLLHTHGCGAQWPVVRGAQSCWCDQVAQEKAEKSWDSCVTA